MNVQNYLSKIKPHLKDGTSEAVIINILNELAKNSFMRGKNQGVSGWTPDATWTDEQLRGS